MQTVCFGFYPEDDNTSEICAHYRPPKRCSFFIDGVCSYCEGVTTIPEGSTLETMEAHSPEASGDDIVCSYEES